MPETISWIQGIRPPGDVKPSMSWKELLLRRLRGRYKAIPSGDTTLLAESMLDLGRNVYFHVGHCFPRFGHVIVAHDGFSSEADNMTAVTPFDTGGMANGKVKTITLLDDASKRDLVQKFSYNAYDYTTHFDKWIEESFPQRRDYLIGTRPVTSLVNEIAIANCTSEAWIWEARILAHDYSGPPVAPTNVVFKSGHKTQYVDWIYDSRILGIAEAKDHIDMIEKIGVESDIPVNDMLDLLVERQT